MITSCNIHCIKVYHTGGLQEGSEALFSSISVVACHTQNCIISVYLKGHSATEKNCNLCGFLWELDGSLTPLILASLRWIQWRDWKMFCIGFQCTCYNSTLPYPPFPMREKEATKQSLSSVPLFLSQVYPVLLYFYDLIFVESANSLFEQLLTHLQNFFYHLRRTVIGQR